MQLFIAIDWECGFSLLSNLRPLGASRSLPSRAHPWAGRMTWRHVSGTWTENCRGRTPCSRYLIAQMSTSWTSSSSLGSTWTGTSVSSRMPTLWGVLVALDSFSHCAPIWIWLHCLRKLTLVPFKWNEPLCDDWHFAWPMLPRFEHMVPYIEEATHGTSVGPASKARDLSLLSLWN